jgi:S1-C subfamily serine protease
MKRLLAGVASITAGIFGIIAFTINNADVKSSGTINNANTVSPTLAAKIASGTVVKIIGPGSTGSGTLIEVPKPDGTGVMPVVVTAAHVLKGTGKAETIQIKFYDDSFTEVKGADIIAIEEVDLAFIKLDTSVLASRNYLSAKIGNPNTMTNGDSIVVSGYPLESKNNVSNRARISTGVIQTFSSSDVNKSLVGYNATTFPGMSGGGVFNDKGELVFIHLKGERDMYTITPMRIDPKSKSGTNYGISVLHALNRLREIDSKSSELADPLSRFMRGLFFVRSNKIDAAYKIFSQLHREYPDSLVAEWSAKCMEAQVKHPNGNPVSPFSVQKEFFKKHGINPVYPFAYFSDSTIWNKNERRILLSNDPIYRLARPLDDMSFDNRGGLVDVTYRGHCEYIPGILSYKEKDSKAILYWAMITNPSDYTR